MKSLVHDFRFAVRSLARNPGFALVAILTLALGIGANAAIFSVINSVLLQPLPYQNGSELVLIEQSTREDGMDHEMAVSVQELEDYRERTRSLDGVAEYHSLWFTLLEGGEPERVQSGVVSSNYFQVMGIQPILGRAFLPSEDTQGAPPVLILSYDFWQNRFAGDPSVVGRTVEMNDQIHTVVGVLPSDLPEYPGDNDVWMPWYACPFRATDMWQENRAMRSLTAIGRMALGVTVEQAASDVARIAREMRSEYPAAYPDAAGFQSTVSPLRAELTEVAEPVFLILLAMAGFVLLIACANVTNLTLARMSGREQEISVRAALGASRGRLMGQLITESTVLALAGGVVGLMIAFGVVDLFATFAGRFTPRATEVRVDVWLLLFTLGVSLLSGMAVGMTSALLYARNVAGTLREGGGHSTAGAGRQRVRSLLVASQLAVTFVLLIGAGLMLRSFVNLQQVEPGFETANVLTMQIDLDWTTYFEDDDRRTFYRSLLERTGNIPGVVGVGLAGTIPLNGGLPNTGFFIEGRPAPESGTGPRTDLQNVSPGYFDALRIPLLRGRTFTSQDHDEAPDVVIINESMARRYWADEDPIGTRISADGESWVTVIGVVGNVKQEGLAVDFPDQTYTALAQNTPSGANLLIRTAGDPTGVARQAKEAVESIDPRQPVAFIRTMEDVRSESIASPRLVTLLLLLFAGLALTISVAGIAGLIAFTVGQRTRELGIRIALGADDRSVLWMVVRHGVALVLIGLAVGIGAALILTKFIGSWLFQVTPTDPLTFIGISIVFAAAAALAAYLPARRAVGVDPMVALRTE